MSFVILALTGAALAAPQRDRRADCTSYKGEEACLDEAPSSANCVWAERYVGGDWDDRSCQTKSCEALNQMNDGVTEGACKDLGGCTWDAENYYCLKTGASLPCSMNYPDPDSPSCPSNCDYSALTQGCITKGSKPLCEVIYDEDSCKKNGCTFYDNVYKCWKTGEEVPCKEFEYYEESDCPSYCEYVQVGGTDDGDEGRCQTPGQVEACEEYYDGQQCPKDRCTWYEDPIYKCISKDKTLACSAQPEKSCQESKTCQWTKEKEPGASNDEPDFGMGFCADCKTDDCHETPTEDDDNQNDGGGYGPDTPDDGKPCAEHKDDGEGQFCPEPRCYMEWPGENGSDNMCGADAGGICRDAVCTDHEYDEAGCTKQTGCTYDSDICYDGSDFPCNKVYDKDECPSGKGCSWVDAPEASGGYQEGDGYCVKQGEGIPCTSFSGNMDGTACEKNDDGTGSNCVWLQAVEECVTNAKAEDLPCSTYNQDPDACPAPKCSLTQGVCWETGKELPCDAICSASACENSGHCTYTEGGMMGMGKCEECEGGKCPVAKACNTYSTEETCPMSHCTFEFDEDGMSDDGDDMGAGGEMKGSCVDHQCVTMYDASECEGSKLNCKWNAGQFSCWPNAFDKPCETFYDETPCTDAGCDFDSDSYTCAEKGAAKTCSTIYEETECDKLSFCEYKDWSCYEKSTNFPSTPPPLNGNGDGTGNEDYTKCSADDYDKVKAHLEQADVECVIHDRNRRGNSKDQQIECLTYFLAQSPNPTTIAAACPCLWAWATEIKPQEDHWMKLKC